MLRDQLERLGGSVEWGVELIELAPVAAGVEVGLRHADGREERASFQYVIGCDGAHSAVRAALGSELEGGDYAATFVVAEAEAVWPFAADELVVFLGEDGILMCSPLPRGRTLLIGDVPDSESAPAREPDIEEVRDLVAARAAAGVAVHDLYWASRFHLHHRLAAHFGNDRIFLAGDAAHICSLFGGQGMNMGFQDAVNLGWKLALTLAGHARPGLLASYDAERRAVASRELAFTDALHEGLFEHEHSFPEWLRRHYRALLGGLGGASERKRTDVRPALAGLPA